MSRGITVATANVGRKGGGTDLETQLASLTWLVRQLEHAVNEAPHVIAVQEAGRGLRIPGYRTIVTTAPDAFHEPILVRRDLDVWFASAEAADSGEPGPAAYRKWLSIAVVDGPFPSRVAILNGHVNSAIERHGKPNPAASPLRMAAAEFHIELYRDWAAFWGHELLPVIALGDFNIDAEADRRERTPTFPAAMLGKIALTDSRKLLAARTLGVRNVDRILGSHQLEAAAGGVLPRRAPHNHRFAWTRFVGRDLDA